MNIITLKNLFMHSKDYKNKTVTVAGWIKTLRASKTVGFIELNDGTAFTNLQIVFSPEQLPDYADIAKENVGAALIVTGTLVPTPQLKQDFEIQAETIVVEGKSTSSYPLQKKKHSLEYLRSIAHLRPRTNTLGAVFRVRSAAAYAIHNFFQERDFQYIHTPIITGNDCEGAGEMFRVTTLDMENPPRTQEGNIDYHADFFGKPVALTVSGQLEGEAMAMAFSRIYTFGPTFRAENSNTPRHAGEFWMIEPEIAFADLVDDMHLASAMLKSVIGEVLERCPEEMAFFCKFYDHDLLQRLNHLITTKFKEITYTEAIALLEKAEKPFAYPVFWGCDLQTEHERYLTEEVFNAPVFVTDYPKEIKAFYMRQNNDGKTVAAMDLLVPGVGEIIGGSQREERYDILLERIEELGLKPENYAHYLDLRKYGSVRHAGFGLGFERLLMYLTGIANIRDVIPFPRTTGSASD